MNTNCVIPTLKFNYNDSVGDSLGKHNYNALVLDTNVCNLSSQFFLDTDNINTIFQTITSYINTFSQVSAYYNNDKVYAKAKFTNLTKDAKKVTVGISLNDKIMSSKEVSIKNEYVDSILLSADNLNSIHWKAS
jgi:hypothetical protein